MCKLGMAARLSHAPEGGHAPGQRLRREKPSMIVFEGYASIV